MAIARDNNSAVTYNGGLTSVSSTAAFTVSSNNPIVFAGIRTSAVAPSSVICNATPMTLADTASQGSLKSYLYYAQGVSGSASIAVITPSADDIFLAGVSFSGAVQSGLDSHSNGTAVGSANITISTTSVADKSWSVAVFSGNGTVNGVGSGTTDIVDNFASNSNFIITTHNADITPAGSTSQAVTQQNANNFSGAIATFAPAAVVAGGHDGRFLSILGVGR